MCGLSWGALYERYHLTPYDPARRARRMVQAKNDFDIKAKKEV